jgi:hypothetical protein
MRLVVTGGGDGAGREFSCFQESFGVSGCSFSTVACVVPVTLFSNLSPWTSATKRPRSFETPTTNREIHLEENRNTRNTLKASFFKTSYDLTAHDLASSGRLQVQLWGSPIIENWILWLSTTHSESYRAYDHNI